MPKTDELIFALKTFAGAMAALYLAFYLGLENPYWSMATAYIVSLPLTGAMRSKSLYRFIGTAIGGTAAVALVPPLVDAPVLLSLALALWVGLCLYLSLLDRTPRAYTFMLAGYTAAIIGFPSVADPAATFQTALTRVEEISLGIACTTVIGTVVLPRAIGPVLARRISGWVRPGIDWAVAALEGHEDQSVIAPARRKLAVEAADVAMTTQLAYDTSPMQSAVRHITRLRIYVLSLMPVLSSISDRVTHLRRMEAITPELQSVLDETAGWVKVGGPEKTDALLAQIAALEEDGRSWAGLLRASLAVRLDELVRIIGHARAIRRHVLEGDPAPNSAVVRAEFIATSTQLRDHGMAMLSALAAALAILLVCAFWIETAWPGGAGAAVMVAISCSFFAAQDDPAPAIAQLMRDSVIGVIGAAFYIFVVLPRVETFAEMALVLLPACLVVGVLVARPATFLTGMMLGAFGSTSLAINNGYVGDFTGFANAALSLIVGTSTALVVTRLIRSVGAAWSARRLLRGGWEDIAAAAQARAVPDRAELTGRMMDRLGLLMPRLASLSPGADHAAAALLNDLRVGLNVVGLQRYFSSLPLPAQHDIAAVLAGIAAHYRGNPQAEPQESLLQALDAAISALASEAERYRQVLMMLSGLRSLLFAAAPPPEIGPSAAEPMRQIA